MPADPRFTPLPEAFFRRPADAVARDLLGRYLVRRLDPPDRLDGRDEERLVLRLVETEAYRGEGDRASHAHAGPVTPRSRKLFREGGRAYVYLIYGMHHCLNAVSGSRDDGSAVLLRAGEPVEGAERMARHRSRSRKPRPGDLAGGPGKLCQALVIDRSFDGEPLWEGDPALALTLAEGEPVPDSEVVRGPRVGVAYAGEAAHWPLRFAIAGNPHVSKPRL